MTSISPIERIRARLRPAEPGVVEPADEPIVERCRPYTMTSPARLQAVIDGVRHVERTTRPGALVECGVWRGGSVLAMVLTLQQLGNEAREIYLFDTFTGMTEPTEADVSPLEGPASEEWNRAHAAGERAWDWIAVAQEQVRETVLSTGYPAERVHLVAGPVEETIPGGAPEEIALLRLDTDWYESTRHELTHLYPRLASGGVLVVDDYGHWEGARRAVDEHFATLAAPPLLARTDYTGRLGVKP